MLHPLRNRHALLAALVPVAGLALATTAFGQSQGDPPDRAARLNYISGQVSFRPASLDDWGVATLNYPLTTGDHLWTDSNAQAELHVGATAIRLAPETAFSFLNLDDDMMQARVAEGAIDVRVRDLTARDAYEVDTPHAAISLVSPGTYRIDVDPDGDRTRVIVRAGQVEVNGNGGAFSLYAGDMAEISGADEMRYDISRAPAPDGWERWCRSRDQREDDRLATRYVSRDMTGYEDLDDYGTWDYVPEYGWAWQPTVVAVDWAPYRYGHWAWRARWGWTWIDAAPWGFAPFHYGRWAYQRSHWYWVPGRLAARPVWAPALVAFVGGPGWNISFGFGMRPAVGWFPLAPGEPYCPPYRVSALYARNVNITNVNVANVNVTRVNAANLHYANRGIPGALTAVPRDVFVGSQPVRRVALAMPRGAAEQVPVVGHGAALAPETRSVMGYIPAAVPRPRASIAERPVLARAHPPADVVRADPVVPLGSRDARIARPAAGQPAAVAPGSASRDEVGNARVPAPVARPRAGQDRPADVSDRPGGRRPFDSQPGTALAPAGVAQGAPSARRGAQGTEAAGAAPATGANRPPEVLVHDGQTPGWRPAGSAKPAAPPASVYDRSSANERRAPAYDRSTASDRPADAGASTPRRGYERPSVSDRSAPRDERPMADQRPGSPSAPAPGARGSEAPRPEGNARGAASERPSSEQTGARSGERGQDRAAPPSQAERAPAARGAGVPERGASRPQPQQSGGRGGQTGGQGRGQAAPRGPGRG